MAIKTKYIKDLPLKEVLDGSESLLVQDLNGTQQASLGTILDEIKQNSQEKIGEIESDLAQTNAQLSQIEKTKADTTITNNLQTQINSLVLESGGDSDLEVVQARGGYDVLNDRLTVQEKINENMFYSIFNREIADCFDFQPNLWGYGDVQLKYANNNTWKYADYTVDGFIIDETYYIGISSALNHVNQDYIIDVLSGESLLVRVQNVNESVSFVATSTSLTVRFQTIAGTPSNSDAIAVYSGISIRKGTISIKDDKILKTYDIFDINRVDEFLGVPIYLADNIDVTATMGDGAWQNKTITYPITENTTYTFSYSELIGNRLNSGVATLICAFRDSLGNQIGDNIDLLYVGGEKKVAITSPVNATSMEVFFMFTHSEGFSEKFTTTWKGFSLLAGDANNITIKKEAIPSSIINIIDSTREDIVNISNITDSIREDIVNISNVTDSIREDIVNISDSIREETFELHLPKDIYVAIGYPIEIYNHTICRCGNINNYHFVWNLPKGGSAYNDKLLLNPSEDMSGNTSTLTLEVYDNKYSLIKTQTSTLHCVKPSASLSPSSARKILAIGDSLTDISTWRVELYNRFAIDIASDKIKYLGTLGSEPYLSEGHSGWSLNSYITNSSEGYNGDYKIKVATPPTVSSKKQYKFGSKIFEYEKTVVENGATWVYFNRISGSGFVTTSDSPCVEVNSAVSGDRSIAFTEVEVSSLNPFYNNGFDCNHYSETYLNGVIPDDVIIWLGTNGGEPSMSIESVRKKVESEMKKYKDILDNISSNWNNTKVFVCYLHYRPDQNGQGYTSGVSSAKAWDNYIFEFNKQLFETFKDYSNVILVPVGQTFDRVNNYPTKHVQVNPRNNETMAVAGDTVHMSQSTGFLQVADAIYGAYVNSLK